MDAIEVRIVRLEPMRVASAHGFGDSPEGIAASKMLAWARPKGILDKPFRWFGFDNPAPSPGSSNYGYEVWVPVGPEVQPEGDIKVKSIPGGSYCVTHCPRLSVIGDTWQRLVIWREESGYATAYHQCLEELLVAPDSTEDELEFDLYLPIAE